jgi:hypothetical protein
MVAPVVARRFPDVTRMLVTALEVWVPDGTHTGPETPEDLQAKLPFIRAYRMGGGRDRLNDYATVAVDVFDATYTGAESLAEDIAQWLCGPPPPLALIDRIDPDVSPRRLPWGDDRLVRFQAQYSLVTRRVVR